MRRALVVFNPHSGAQRGAAAARTLSAMAAAREIELVVRETSATSPTAELLGDAASFDRVIAAGGDGTLMEVFTGLMRAHSRGPLAMVPAGTGNVLARALGVPTDLERACDLALDAHARVAALDLGRAQFADEREAYFALRLSAGYEARVLETTTRELKSTWGILAYFAQGVAHALQQPNADYRCVVDGSATTQRANAALVVNHGALGVLGMTIAPDISPHDGALDLCLISIEPGASLSRMAVERSAAAAAIAGRKSVLHEVVVEADPPQPVQADGDVIGATPVRVTPVAGAVDVCLPA